MMATSCLSTSLPAFSSPVTTALVAHARLYTISTLKKKLQSFLFLAATLTTYWKQDSWAVDYLLTAAHVDRPISSVLATYIYFQTLPQQSPGTSLPSRVTMEWVCCLYATKEQSWNLTPHKLSTQPLSNPSPSSYHDHFLKFYFLKFFPDKVSLYSPFSGGGVVWSESRSAQMTLLLCMYVGICVCAVIYICMFLFWIICINCRHCILLPTGMSVSRSKGL